MKWYLKAIQNASSFPGSPPPTIVIDKNSPNWSEAYNNWVKGVFPTDSPEWKKGVIAIGEYK